MLTRDRRKALEWFLAKGDVGTFGAGSPSRVMRYRLQRDGLIETFGQGRPSGFMILKFRISQAGKDALAAK